VKTFTVQLFPSSCYFLSLSTVLKHPQATSFAYGAKPVFTPLRQGRRRVVPTLD